MSVGRKTCGKRREERREEIHAHAPHLPARRCGMRAMALASLAAPSLQLFRCSAARIKKANITDVGWDAGAIIAYIRALVLMCAYVAISRHLALLLCSAMAKEHRACTCRAPRGVPPSRNIRRLLQRGVNNLLASSRGIVLCFAHMTVGSRGKRVAYSNNVARGGSVGELWRRRALWRRWRRQP